MTWIPRFTIRELFLVASGACLSLGIFRLAVAVEEVALAVASVFVGVATLGYCCGMLLVDDAKAGWIGVSVALGLFMLAPILYAVFVG